MKDGRTHLAHKAEQAVDMETGAVVAVTVQGANQGDTTTLPETMIEAAEQVAAVAQDAEANENLAAAGIEEVVADKGYHSNDVVTDLSELGMRSYISEPERGRRRWRGKEREQQAVYANRRRIRGAFNLSLVVRKKLGAGTPRGLAAAKTAFASLQKVLCALYRPRGRRCLGLATFWAVDRLPLDSQCWNFQTAQQSEDGHFCHGLLGWEHINLTGDDYIWHKRKLQTASHMCTLEGSRQGHVPTGYRQTACRSPGGHGGAG